MYESDKDTPQMSQIRTYQITNKHEYLFLQQYEPGYTAPAPKKCKNSNEVMTIR